MTARGEIDTFELAPAPLAEIDSASRILRPNLSFHTHYPEMRVGSEVTGLFSRGQAAELRAFLETLDRGVAHGQVAEFSQVNGLAAHLRLVETGSGGPAAVLYLEAGRRDGSRGPETDRWHRLMQKLLPSASDTITVLDAEGRIMGIPGIATSVLGYPPEWCKGRSVADLMHPDDLDKGLTLLDEALESPGEDHVTELRAKYPDGHFEWIELMAVNHLADPDIAGMVVTARNISYRKQIEQELRSSRDSALALAQTKSNFVATVSHEIRSPLHAILGFSELLENQLSSEGHIEAKEWSGRIRSEAERLTRLIEDLLDLSRLEAGRAEIASKAFRLRGLVDDVIQIFRLKTEPKGLYLGYSVDPTVSDWRTGDADRLHQVLLNLVSNATKFTREGRIDVEVSPVASQTSADLVRFAVTDTGPGIPGEEIDRIMEPFAQVWGSDADRGSGLGLAISDGLVKAMGGDGLAVSSLEGHGSTFHFALPLPESQQPTSSQESEPIETDSNRTVLVVDDNTVNQLLVEAQLKKLGYSCEAASGGAEALERLESGRFELVLMDCHMPGMDGYEATRRIRARERGTGVHIPVLALSASALGSNRDACERAGMDGFLSKPLPLSILAAEIGRFLGTGEADGIDTEAEASRAGQGMSNTPILDDARVDRLLVELGPGPLQKVASTFIAEMPRRLAELCRVAAERDADAVRRSAHAIRSPSAMLGVVALAEQLGVVEESKDPVSNVSEARLNDLIKVSMEQLRAKVGQHVDPEGGAQ